MICAGQYPTWPNWLGKGNKTKDQVWADHIWVKKKKLNPHRTWWDVQWNNSLPSPYTSRTGERGGYVCLQVDRVRGRTSDRFTVSDSGCASGVRWKRSGHYRVAGNPLRRTFGRRGGAWLGARNIVNSLRTLATSPSGRTAAGDPRCPGPWCSAGIQCITSLTWNYTAWRMGWGKQVGVGTSDRQDM